MRLTLRTLLAYMDDVLDPADQEDLGRKIEQSPFATELIHRSRDAVRRLRLSAPEALAADSGDLHGDSATLDANTTSEYLDSTLSPDAVADFERSCLEAGNNADMLLAEAASCHHILTMVLGEPAEVDADLRQRLYAIAQSPAAATQVRVEPAHATPVNSSVTPPLSDVPAPVPVAPAPRRPAVDPDEASVPDYMLAAARQRRRSKRALAATLAAFVVGGAGALYVWNENQKPVATPDEVAELGDIEAITGDVQVGDLGAAPAVETSASGEPAASTAASASAAAGGDAPAFTPDSTLKLPPVVPTETPLDVPALELPAAPGPETAAATTAEVDAAMSETPAAAAPTDAAAATLESTVAQDAAAVAPDASEVPLGPAAEAGDVEVVEEVGMALTSPETSAATAAADVPPLAAPAAADETTPTPADTTLADSAPEVPMPATTSETTSETPADPVMVADASAAAAPAVDALTLPGETATPDEPPTAEEAKPIGAYLGNNDVLLRLDSAENVWKRVPPRTPLAAGETLLSLPAFRTHVVLADANVYLSGGAEIELLAPGAGSGASAAEFGLRVPYGQVVLNSGLNGNRIDLISNGVDRLLQLGPSSSLAIEVRRTFVPGPALNREPAPVEMSWYLTSGSLEWRGEKIEAPAAWTTIVGEDSPPIAIEDLPQWVDREPIADSERRARDEIAEALAPAEAVNVRLLELSDPSDRGRRTEVRSLAARSGAYVGLYDALVSALGDTNQRASWKTQIEALRQAIARDPSAAEGIREAFALERGQDAADDLMELLLGFDATAVGTNREEVKNGALVRIIRWMDDDDLAYRVLASYNWDEITAKKLFGNYRPEQNDAQRERALRHHWDRLEKGELVIEPKKS